VTEMFFPWSAGARWDDPVDGRWISQDPLGLFADSNPYRFVYNNPTQYDDLSGLAPTQVTSPPSSPTMANLPPLIPENPFVNPLFSFPFLNGHLGFHYSPSFPPFSSLFTHSFTGISLTVPLVPPVLPPIFSRGLHIRFRGPHPSHDLIPDELRDLGSPRH